MAFILFVVGIGLQNDKLSEGKCETKFGMFQRISGCRFALQAINPHEFPIARGLQTLLYLWP
jgi:hypothetical protein